MKNKCFWCNKRKDSYFGTNYGTCDFEIFNKKAKRLSKKRKSRFLCDECYAGYNDE